MAGASFTPDLIWEDKYFNDDPDRPLTRREAVLWIAKHIRREDNCVTKKGELDASLRFLAGEWNWAKTTVERFLKKCEKLGILVLKKCKINGTVQYVISYYFSTLSAFSTKVSGTASGTGVGQERDKVKSRKSEEKKDSPVSPQGDEPDWTDQARAEMAATGADTSPKQPESTAAAHPTPNCAPPPPRKPRAKCEAPDLDNWRPKQATIEQMMKETGAMARDIEWEMKKMLDWCRTTTKPVKDLEARFRNWMRSWKDGQSNRSKYKSYEEAFKI